jgi:hypothetical protein
MGKPFKFIVVTFFASTLLASCAVTTRMTEGTSETFVNTSEASTKFTSSTSPRGDSEDSADATQYIRINMARLRAEMAVGQGEHLTNLAILMDIENTKKPAFYSMTKEKFGELFSSSNVSAEELLGKLYIEISKLPVS